MGAISIHEVASKKVYRNAVEAYEDLVDNAREQYGTDPYSGTIATTQLQGKISEPENYEDFYNKLDAIHKRDCWYYETDEHYHFIGWASS
jgi:hypothetical protein